MRISHASSGPMTLGLSLALFLTGCGGGEFPAPEYGETPSDYFRRADVYPAGTRSIGAKPEYPGVVYLDQAWTEGDRLWSYYTNHGTELVRYEWFLAVERAENEELIRSDSSIRELRFLPGPHHPELNPERLPVGFAKRIREDKAWVGFTCAACHTAEFAYQGTTIRLDGGGMFASPYRLMVALRDGFSATLNNPEKWDRFAERVLSASSAVADETALRREVVEYADLLRAYLDRNEPAHPFGFGRLDSFGILNNQYAGTAYGIEANYRTPTAPVATPYIWEATDLDWRHYNSSVLLPLQTDVNEPFDPFGHVRVRATSLGLLRVETIWDPRIAVELEIVASKLTAPKWPEQILGPIDSAKTNRGRVLYRERHEDKYGVVRPSCADCHMGKRHEGSTIPEMDDCVLGQPYQPGISDPTEGYRYTCPNRYGVRFLDTVKVPLDELDTDPEMALNFASRKVFTGPFSGYFGGREEVSPFELWRPLLAIGTLEAYGGIPPLQQFIVDNAFHHAPPPFPYGSNPPNLFSYKAKPMAGIWAGAPFLHNGSIPNLYQLLVPEQRVEVFYTGGREYDPIRVGLVYDQPMHGEYENFEFDTRLRGNSNRGHLYGNPNWSHDDVMDLIEYLKTF